MLNKPEKLEQQKLSAARNEKVNDMRSKWHLNSEWLPSLFPIQCCLSPIHWNKCIGIGVDLLLELLTVSLYVLVSTMNEGTPRSHQYIHTPVTVHMYWWIRRSVFSFSFRVDKWCHLLFDCMNICSIDGCASWRFVRFYDHIQIDTLNVIWFVSNFHVNCLEWHIIKFETRTDTRLLYSLSNCSLSHGSIAFYGSQIEINRID